MNRIKIAENFSLHEFQDNRTGEVKISENLVKVIQKIRTTIGKSITITSGYRTKTTHMNIYKELYGEFWEDKIAWGSKHLTGEAIDFVISNGTSEDYERALKIAKESGIIKGIGNGLKTNHPFLHIDCRKSDRIVEWGY